MLRKHTALLIGCGSVILLIDVVILFYRALGLDKGTAIYAAFVTVLILGSVAVEWQWRRLPADADQDERLG
jgi:hypothetical protein